MAMRQLCFGSRANPDAEAIALLLQGIGRNRRNIVQGYSFWTYIPTGPLKERIQKSHTLAFGFNPPDIGRGSEGEGDWMGRMEEQKVDA